MSNQKTKKMRFQVMIFSAFLVFASCSNNDQPAVPTVSSNKFDYRQKMREFVIGISNYSKGINPNFAVIPQNGLELLSSDGTATGQPHQAYLNSIDGNGQEGLFYGYETYDQQTNPDKNSALQGFLKVSKNAGKTILIIDYCSTQSKVTNSYMVNSYFGYVSFATNKSLNTIPSFPNPINFDSDFDISNISKAKNFLYLINAGDYATKADFITAVNKTNYDIVIIDLFMDGSAFTSSEINQLKIKANGGKRLAICYVSIGEAENYRYYWQWDWNINKPIWLDAQNPDWPGNYKVKYWIPDWQQIIYGNDNSYLKKILDAGFDGAYLDLIDAFEYYEQKK